jgi:hypothetical protein
LRSIESKPDLKTARTFGVGAFVLLSLVAVWLWLRKHHPTAAASVGGVGALLGVGGLVAPALVWQVRRAWMALVSPIARTLGRVNAFLVLTVVFFVVMTPVALVRRLFGKKAPAGWTPVEPRPRDHFEHPY